MKAQEDTVAALLANVPRDRGVDARDAFGRTALHYAAHMKFVGAMSALLAHEANPALFDRHERNVFHELAHPILHPGKWQLLEAHLLEDKIYRPLSQVVDRHGVAGSGLEEDDEEGNMPLHLAARMAFSPAVDLFLGLGADPERLDGGSDKPLHHAIGIPPWLTLYSYGDEEIIPWRIMSNAVKESLWCSGALPEDDSAVESEGRVEQEIKERREQYLAELSVPRAVLNRASGRGRGRGRLH